MYTVNSEKNYTLEYSKNYDELQESWKIKIRHILVP